MGESLLRRSCPIGNSQVTVIGASPTEQGVKEMKDNAKKAKAPSTELEFERGLDELRPFEVDALKSVGGIGGTFPGKDSRDGVEAQMTINAPVTKEDITVFFKLHDTYGFPSIVAMDPVVHDIYAERAYIWPSDDGTINATILDELVNNRFVLTHYYNGELIRQIFEPAYNYYIPEGWGEAAIQEHLKMASKVRRQLAVQQ